MIFETRFSWMLGSVDELNNPERLLTLSPHDIRSMMPEDPTAPVLRLKRDLRIARAMYQAGSYLHAGGSKFADLQLLGEFFNMTRDSRLFADSASNVGDAFVPLYESKYFHQFDHRYADWIGGEVCEVDGSRKADPKFDIRPKSLYPSD